MTAILQCTLLTILSVEFIIGNLGNAFMALVNIMDWVKRRKISSVDLILSALAVSRIAWLWLILMMLLISALSPASLITEKDVRILNISWTMTNHFSIWLATCLSIFYFLKIANFSSSLFLFLKWRVKKVVPVTMVVSLLFLFINIIVINIKIDTWFVGCKRNISYITRSNSSGQFFRLILFCNIMFALIPFTFFLLTFLLLIFSLWKHLKTIQHTTKGSGDVSTTAHVKVLQTVVSFLLLYTIFFLSLIFQLWNIGSQKKNTEILFFTVMELAFPSGHSCVLILGNTKLRRAFLSVMQCLRCRSKDAEPLGS
uniref:Taste receptor type 2 n=1 Tax=Nannospalax galili TaxID=1026970 RepID=A0A7S6B661_NANGA|nr:taste receptor type 2 member 581 [Nannospalax galili]QKE46334.1 taste receptor type 2 member 581 [Nannospalax galili]QKE46335.1 taste receptor type 2 member 581 [Nannospalax galili]QKE46336.1 taste receptor type 2 member 581 [Nannospalax galili]QKE46337.1 taste receptor type 2 member 581 [Nannospalax galili]